MTSISMERSLEAPRQLIGEAVASQPSAAARSKRRLPGALLTALIGAAVVCASMAAMAASDTAEARRAKASVAKASGGFYGGRTSPNPRVRQSYKRFMTERRQYKQHKKAAIRQTNRDAKRWTAAYNKAYSAGQNVAKQKRQHGADSRRYLAANRRFGRTVGNYIDANNAWNRHTRARAKVQKRDYSQLQAAKKAYYRSGRVKTELRTAMPAPRSSVRTGPRPLKAR
jgi:hypothetical protein